MTESFVAPAVTWSKFLRKAILLRHQATIARRLYDDASDAEIRKTLKAYAEECDVKAEADELNPDFDHPFKLD